MGEGREYVSRPDEMGDINIAEEVLAVIAAATAIEVEGVSALASGLGSDLAELVGRKVLSRGVRLHVEEGKVKVDVAILVQYGSVVPEVARNVQEAVMSAIENTSGLTVSAVNINVAGVTFQHQNKV